jgi:hypothetical protein
MVYLLLGGIHDGIGRKFESLSLLFSPFYSISLLLNFSHLLVYSKSFPSCQDVDAMAADHGSVSQNFLLL